MHSDLPRTWYTLRLFSSHPLKHTNLSPLGLKLLLCKFKCKIRLTRRSYASAPQILHFGWSASHHKTPQEFCICLAS